MKKILSLILVLVFVFCITGCKKDGTVSSDSKPQNNSSELQNGNDSSNPSSLPANTEDENTESEKDNQSNNQTSADNTQQNISSGNSSQNNQSDSSGTSSGNSSDADNTSSKPQNSGNDNNTDKPDEKPESNNSSTIVDPSKCNHTYKEEYFAPTCTEQGYYLYTCPICKDSYKDKFLPAKHVYIDYICTGCGIGDDEEPYLSLIYWIRKFGEIKDNSFFEMYEYQFTSDEGIYSVSAIGEEYITVSFKNNEDTELVEIEIYNTENCDITYILNGFSTSAKVSKQSVASMDNTFIENFIIPEDVSDQAEYKTNLINGINNVLLYFGDNFLKKNLNFTLDIIGFSSEHIIDEIQKTEIIE